MIDLTNISISFNRTKLFSDCNLRFTQGNCYGIIGANGSGKSTLLKMISGDMEPSTGEIVIAKKPVCLF